MSATRSLRKGDIPGNLMSRWQVHGNSARKPLIRRPMTACEACRIAKVRCPGSPGGQKACPRCHDRGIACKYALLDAAASSAASSAANGPTTVAPWSGSASTATDSSTPGAISEVDTQPQFSMAEETWPDQSASIEQLVPGNFHSNSLGLGHGSDSLAGSQAIPTGIDQLPDWATLDLPDLTNEWEFPLSAQDDAVDASHDPSSSHPAPNFTATTTTTTTTTATATAASINAVGNRGFPLPDSSIPLGLPAPPRLSWQTQLLSPSSSSSASPTTCQCRAGLALLIPNAKAAVQGRRLDRVFQVTGDAIRACRAIVSCKLCETACMDLICITAVFQETDVCFKYLAQPSVSEAGGADDAPITVRVGEYEVFSSLAADDAQMTRAWRRMLVTELVRQASALMDALCAKGQELLAATSPAVCRLAEVNIRYLEDVVGNLRGNLNKAVEELA